MLDGSVCISVYEFVGWHSALFTKKFRWLLAVVRINLVLSYYKLLFTFDNIWTHVLCRNSVSNITNDKVQLSPKRFVKTNASQKCCAVPDKYSPGYLGAMGRGYIYWNHIWLQYVPKTSVEYTTASLGLRTSRATRTRNPRRTDDWDTLTPDSHVAGREQYAPDVVEDAGVGATRRRLTGTLQLSKCAQRRRIRFLGWCNDILTVCRKHGTCWNSELLFGIYFALIFFWLYTWFIWINNC